MWILRVIFLWQFFLTYTGICQFLKVPLFWLKRGRNRNCKFFRKPVISIFRLIFLIFLSKYWLLKVCSTSCSVRRYQCFFKGNLFWDIEMLQLEIELECSAKVGFHNKSFVAYLTKKVLKAQKHVIFIFPVGYY